MSPRTVQDPEITPSILAEHMGWSRHRAYREMRTIERAYPGVVRRKPGTGSRLVASASALAPHIRGMKPSNLEREVTLLRSQLRETTERLDAEVESRLEFQRKARAWFARVEALEKGSTARTRISEPPKKTGT